jgi:nucleoside-diphosphate-sugar epimerase
MKVLITGAGGFLGHAIVGQFEGRHDLRLMDIRDWETPHERIVGSVADLATCRRALEGCEGLVIAHMASVQEGSYQTPEIPFDSNVKGTANLFFAALEAGIRRVVLVSSTGTVCYWGKQAGSFVTRDLPVKPWPCGRQAIYAVTKACQEIIAESYHREKGMQVAVLRVGYILSSDDPNRVVDKYGTHVHLRHAGNTERRDIGLAARLAIEAPEIGYEIFYVMSSPEAEKCYDMAYTRTRLGWKAQHDFMWLPPADDLPK